MTQNVMINMIDSHPLPFNTFVTKGKTEYNIWCYCYVIFDKDNLNENNVLKQADQESSLTQIQILLTHTVPPLLQESHKII